MKATPANTVVQVAMTEMARHAAAVNAIPDLASVTLVVQFRPDGTLANALVRTEARQTYVRRALSPSD